jgi:hypothetical protein
LKRLARLVKLMAEMAKLVIGVGEIGGIGVGEIGVGEIGEINKWWKICSVKGGRNYHVMCLVEVNLSSRKEESQEFSFLMASRIWLKCFSAAPPREMTASERKSKLRGGRGRGGGEGEEEGGEGGGEGEERREKLPGTLWVPATTKSLKIKACADAYINTPPSRAAPVLSDKILEQVRRGEASKNE